MRQFLPIASVNSQGHVNETDNGRAAMMKRKGTRKVAGCISAAVAVLASMMLTGCAGFVSAPSTVLQSEYTGVKGSVMGGQQPIVGATIKVYAAGTTGYGSAATPLATTGSSVTDASGAFTVSYTCNNGTQIYFVAQQGIPNGGTITNPNEALVAAAGQCENINGVFINIDEVSTVGSVAALAPFMTGIANVGTSASNTAGLAHAFASVNKLVNISSGQAGGSALPAGAVAPVAEINTLADAIALCVNSVGGTAGDPSACGKLFTAATVGSNAAPADTLTAAMNIAQHPTTNVGSICALAQVNSPFKPILPCSSVKDWSMSVIYAPSGVYDPQTTTIDKSGQVWIANSGAGNNAIVLAQTGVPVATLPVSAAINTIAIDSSGNGWVATGAPSILEFSPSFAPIGTPITTGLSSPNALAFDTAGILWVADSGNNTLSEFNPASTTPNTPINSVSVTSPTFVTIDPK